MLGDHRRRRERRERVCRATPSVRPAGSVARPRARIPRTKTNDERRVVNGRESKTGTERGRVGGFCFVGGTHTKKSAVGSMDCTRSERGAEWVY